MSDEIQKFIETVKSREGIETTTSVAIPMEWLIAAKDFLDEVLAYRARSGRPRKWKSKKEKDDYYNAQRKKKE